MQPSQPHTFQTTQWTKVIAARDNSSLGRQALKELCDLYYEPVTRFISRFQGNALSESVETPQDLAHAFFARLLEGGAIVDVDRAKGRFRSYLLGAVKHFLMDQRDRASRQRRGGDRSIHSLDAALPTESHTETIPVIDPNGFPPDAYFDRQWALALIDRAMQTLQQQHVGQQESKRFEVLTLWLTAPEKSNSIVDACAQLSLSESAFRVAVHRFRKQFRSCVVAEVAMTLDGSATVQEEMQYLLAALAHGGDDRTLTRGG